MLKIALPGRHKKEGGSRQHNSMQKGYDLVFKCVGCMYCIGAQLDANADGLRGKEI